MTFAVLTLLSLDVQAQEESEEAPVLTFEELGWVPPFQVAAFVDDTATGDCDRIDARYGRCIERVNFYQPEPVWWALENEMDSSVLPIVYPDQTQLWVNASEDEQKRWKRSDRKTMRLLAELYAQTWEDIVYRWKESGDPMAIAMKADGFKMLSNMREHVLKLRKSQLYFMDYPTRGSGQALCHQKLCHQIFHGLLRAQSPKFILVMGEACALELFGSQGRPVMGEVGELRCLGTVDQPIQAVWTHHPHFLLDHGHEKRTVMRHLQNVRRLLMKQGLQ